MPNNFVDICQVSLHPKLIMHRYDERAKNERNQIVNQIAGGTGCQPRPPRQAGSGGTRRMPHRGVSRHPANTLAFLVTTSLFSPCAGLLCGLASVVLVEGSMQENEEKNEKKLLEAVYCLHAVQGLPLKLAHGARSQSRLWSK